MLDQLNSLYFIDGPEKDRFGFLKCTPEKRPNEARSISKKIMGSSSVLCPGCGWRYLQACKEQKLQ